MNPHLMHEGSTIGGPGSPGNGEGPPRMFHPLAALFGLHPNMNPGDGVYSQEAFDRIMSELMERNTSGNAPGPASEEAINSLPKKKVDEKMMGSDWKAECSICMDEVELGEEVTELPCHHWFHGQCIKMWLSEHDTCPHCRQGIESHPSGSSVPGNNNNNNSNDRGPGQNLSSNANDDMPARQAPGTFPSSPPYDGDSHGGNGSNNSNGGSLTDRIRGIFGGSHSHHESSHRD
jgi:E3 ubiquitin-protein ligase RNF115/126